MNDFDIEALKDWLREQYEHAMESSDNTSSNAVAWVSRGQAVVFSDVFEKIVEMQCDLMADAMPKEQERGD